MVKREKENGMKVKELNGLKRETMKKIKIKMMILDNDLFVFFKFIVFNFNLAFFTNI